MMELAGKVAVITGAASGIGAALAKESVAQGMRVVLADVDADSLRAFTSTLEGDFKNPATRSENAARSLLRPRMASPIVGSRSALDQPLRTMRSFPSRCASSQADSA